MLHEDCLAVGLTPKKIQKIANDDTVRYRYYDSSGNLVYKACTKCNDILPAGRFSFRNRTIDQLETRCKTCFSLDEKSYRDRSPGYMKNKNRRAVHKRLSRSPEQLADAARTLRPDGKKTCITCGTYKELTLFANNRTSPDGRSGVCMECDRLDKKTRRDADPRWGKDIAVRCNERYRLRTDEQVLADRKRLRPTGNKTCKTCKQILPLTLYYNSRTEADGLSSACTPCVRDYLLWKKKLSIELYWTSKNIPLECYVCGDTYSHIDHVVPKSKHGGDELTNLLPLCVHHNTSKSDIPLDQWLYRKHPYEMERVLRKVIFEYGVNPFP